MGPGDRPPNRQLLQMNHAVQALNAMSQFLQRFTEAYNQGDAEAIREILMVPLPGFELGYRHNFHQGISYPFHRIVRQQNVDQWGLVGLDAQLMATMRVLELHHQRRTALRPGIASTPENHQRADFQHWWYEDAQLRALPVTEVFIVEPAGLIRRIATLWENGPGQPHLWDPPEWTMEPLAPEGQPLQPWVPEPPYQAYEYERTSYQFLPHTLAYREDGSVYATFEKGEGFSRPDHSLFQRSQRLLLALQVQPQGYQHTEGTTQQPGYSREQLRLAYQDPDNPAHAQAPEYLEGYFLRPERYYHCYRFLGNRTEDDQKRFWKQYQVELQAPRHEERIQDQHEEGPFPYLALGPVRMLDTNSLALGPEGQLQARLNKVLRYQRGQGGPEVGEGTVLEVPQSLRVDLRPTYSDRYEHFAQGTPEHPEPYSQEKIRISYTDEGEEQIVPGDYLYPPMYGHRRALIDWEHDDANRRSTRIERVFFIVERTAQEVTVEAAARALRAEPYLRQSVQLLEGWRQVPDYSSYTLYVEGLRCRTDQRPDASIYRLEEPFRQLAQLEELPWIDDLQAGSSTQSVRGVIQYDAQEEPLTFHRNERCPHQYRQEGWEHDDLQKASKPKWVVFLERKFLPTGVDQPERLVDALAQVRDYLKPEFSASRPYREVGRTEPVVDPSVIDPALDPRRLAVAQTVHYERPDGSRFDQGGQCQLELVRRVQSNSPAGVLHLRYEYLYGGRSYPIDRLYTLPQPAAAPQPAPVYNYYTTAPNPPPPGSGKPHHHGPGGHHRGGCHPHGHHGRGGHGPKRR